MKVMARRITALFKFLYMRIQSSVYCFLIDTSGPKPTQRTVADAAKRFPQTGRPQQTSALLIDEYVEAPCSLPRRRGFVRQQGNGIGTVFRQTLHDLQSLSINHAQRRNSFFSQKTFRLQNAVNPLVYEGNLRKTPRSYNYGEYAANIQTGRLVCQASSAEPLNGGVDLPGPLEHTIL